MILSSGVCYRKEGVASNGAATMQANMLRPCNNAYVDIPAPL